MSEEPSSDRPAPDHAERRPTTMAEPETRTGSEADSHAPTPEHFDVLIVGAGISGIGAAHHLTVQCPGITLRGA